MYRLLTPSVAASTTHGEGHSNMSPEGNNCWLWFLELLCWMHMPSFYSSSILLDSRVMKVICFLHDTFWLFGSLLVFESLPSSADLVFSPVNCSSQWYLGKKKPWYASRCIEASAMSIAGFRTWLKLKLVLLVLFCILWSCSGTSRCPAIWPFPAFVFGKV